jgi:hypothetical protein
LRIEAKKKKKKKKTPSVLTCQKFSIAISSSRLAPYSSAKPAAAASPPNSSMPRAAVCLGAQAWAAVVPELVAVALADAPVAVAEPLLEAAL